MLGTNTLCIQARMTFLPQPPREWKVCSGTRQLLNPSEAQLALVVRPSPTLLQPPIPHYHQAEGKQHSCEHLQQCPCSAPDFLLLWLGALATDGLGALGSQAPTSQRQHGVGAGKRDWAQGLSLGRGPALLPGM